MASAAGGMEIEEVAKDHPEAILREKIDPATGFQPYQARKLAFGLGLTPEQVGAAVPFFQSLYRAFIETDASMIEINPLRGDGRREAGGAGCESELLMTTRCTGIRNSRTCATWKRKHRWKWKLRNSN